MEKSIDLKKNNMMIVTNIDWSEFKTELLEAINNELGSIYFDIVCVHSLTIVSEFCACEAEMRYDEENESESIHVRGLGDDFIEILQFLIFNVRKETCFGTEFSELSPDYEIHYIVECYNGLKYYITVC